MRIRRSVVRKNIPTSSHLERVSSLARSLARVRYRGVTRSSIRSNVATSRRTRDTRACGVDARRCLASLTVWCCVVWCCGRQCRSSQHQTSTLSTTRPTFGVSLGVVASRGPEGPARYVTRYATGAGWKTRELNGVSARDGAVRGSAVRHHARCEGGRAIENRCNTMLPEGHVWDMPATRVRERTRLKEKIERWAQLGVKVTVMDNETTSVSLDQEGATERPSMRRLKASRSEGQKLKRNVSPEET